MASTVNPDMEVIKEIPGYKVILKAVLKSQIQQLVESLASHTDEETVILTASVADGTLSHLGSDSGKTFLTDHEDIKSQFLGHCLKRSHEKRREKEREEEEARIMQQMQKSRPHPIGPPMMGVGMPHLTTPPRMHPAPRLRGPSPRHQPYGRAENHPARINTSQLTSTPKTSTSTVVKVEKDDSSDFGVNNSNISTGNTSGQSSPRVDNSAGQNESSVNEQSELGQDIPGSEQLSLGADLSKLVDDTSSQVGSETASTSLGEAGAMNIKVEALNDSDMELEIVGVEPGHVPESVDWGPNTSQEQDWSGMPDSQQYNQTYSQDWDQAADYYVVPSDDARSGSKYTDQKKIHQCVYCPKVFARKHDLYRHTLIHTDEKPYECEVCGRRFRQKYHCVTHRHVKHNISHPMANNSDNNPS